jgi:hypothetical protein
LEASQVGAGIGTQMPRLPSRNEPVVTRSSSCFLFYTKMPFDRSDTIKRMINFFAETRQIPTASLDRRGHHE